MEATLAEIYRKLDKNQVEELNEDKSIGTWTEQADTQQKNKAHGKCKSNTSCLTPKRKRSDIKLDETILF